MGSGFGIAFGPGDHRLHAFDHCLAVDRLRAGIGCKIIQGARILTQGQQTMLNDSFQIDGKVPKTTRGVRVALIGPIFFILRRNCTIEYMGDFRVFDRNLSVHVDIVFGQEHPARQALDVLPAKTGLLSRSRLIFFR